MNRGWGDSQGFIAEDEGNYGSAQGQRSPPEYSGCSQSKIRDEGDLQFWAEDELSSIESNSRLKKRKRRHSVSYRNQKYRSRSRAPQSSSSSGKSSCTRTRRRRKRRRANTEDTPTNSKPPKPSIPARGKISVKNPLKKFRLKFQRK
ncbi:uncharacterized protein LOC107038418 [Diachasma alloeum]|uniref:uncharacterized protein LOC107038418 n=1 Tax=Diachasma alloeum TaxID=454923 RepID=UPI00073846EB|nr:uncharacterized protein LOC107038418 [Diachasma alloeum]